MSLVKSPELTAAKLAANQANGRQTHGPSAEGIGRIRAANTRHGFYAQTPAADMRLLGEDPDEFERLVESLAADWQPENEYQIGLVRRMARLMWRIERYDRIQESLMIFQMECMDDNVAREVREEADAYERQVGVLKALVWALDSSKFASTSQQLDGLTGIYGKTPSGVGFDILLRAYRLLPVGLKGDHARMREELAAKGAVDSVTLAIANNLDIATGSERDVVRAELCVLLRGEIKRMDEEHEGRHAELKKVSPAFRDSMLVPKHPRAEVIRRMQDSDLRQLRYVTDLLLKLKRGAQQAAASQRNVGVEIPHDVIENTAT